MAQAHLDQLRRKLAELQALERTLVGFVETCTAACAGGPASDCVILDDLAEPAPAALLRVSGRIAMALAANKLRVQRLVDEVINGRQLDRLDELCTPALAPKLRLAFMQFREVFGDWKQTVVELVAEGDTVAARFRCEGTETGDWLGIPATGRRMRIDDVYFFRFENGRITRLWAWRTPGPAGTSSRARTPIWANFAH